MFKRGYCGLIAKILQATALLIFTAENRRFFSEETQDYANEHSTKIRPQVKAAVSAFKLNSAQLIVSVVVAEAELPAWSIAVTTIVYR